MKKRLSMFVLTLALVFTMLPFGAADVFAVDGQTVHNEIAGLPSESDATLKNYAPIMKVMDEVTELAAIIKNGGDNSALAGLTEDDLMKMQALTGKMFDLRSKIMDGKVKGIKVKAGKKKATVSWKKFTDTGVTYTYEVYQGTDKYGDFKKVATTKSTKKVIKKLKKGKKYYFYVIAVAKVKGADGKTERLETQESKYVRSKKIK